MGILVILVEGTKRLSEGVKLAADYVCSVTLT